MTDENAVTSGEPVSVVKRSEAPPEVEVPPLVCIRLNCVQQGVPTFAMRCPTCEHPTQLGTSNRWPRGLRY